LDKLQDLKISATFFIVAEDFTSVQVRRIAGPGHEVASHCVNHSSYKQISEKQWQENVIRSKKILEDASGKKVKGFRAPSWSVEFNKASFHHNVLKEAGYIYDSSFSPAQTKLYGDKRFNKKPYISNEGIVEFPLPVIGFPAAPWVGGAYLRLAPKWYARHFIRKEKPCFLYAHPWEFYKNEEKLPQLSLFNRFVTTYGRKRFFEKTFDLVSELQKDFTFITLEKQAEQIRNPSK